jgi:hypothetical protein
MPALDIIKEYLVSLGFEVDKPTFDKSQQSIKSMDKAVSDFSGSAIKNFAKTGSSALKNFAIAEVAVSSFFVAANVGIAKYISGLAEADLKNEMFARKMWMSKDNAIAYKNSLSALGADIQDLYLSPELLQKFNQLRQQAFTMETPEEYSNQMKNIRSIIFEFQRLKLEASYAMQWIGYYLYQYLEKPITEIKEKLADFNDKLTLHMPQWTKQVAQFVSWFVRLGEAGVWGIQRLWDAFNQLSPKTKEAGGVMLGFFALLKSGPIGWIIAGLTTLLLLLDDYKTYQEGGKSLFAGQWEALDKFKNGLKDNEDFNKLSKAFDDATESFNEFLTTISRDRILVTLRANLWSIGHSVTSIFDGVSKDLGFKNFFDMLEKTGIKVLEKVNAAVGGIAGALKTIDGILHGDSKKTEEGAVQFGKGFNNFVFNDDIGGHLNKALDYGNKWDFGGVAKEWLASIFGGDIIYNFEDDVKSSFKQFNNIFDKLYVSPSLPYAKHADGGIQTTPHLGWVAEKYPESIIPLDPSKRQNALNLLNQTAGLMSVPMASTTVQNITNVNFTNTSQYKIYGSEPTATARAIDRTQPDYGLMLRNFRGAY